jgi:cardiolipin synthase
MAPVPPWLPNAISGLRIAAVPAWAVAAEVANRQAEAGVEHADARAWTLGILLGIGASDLVDGYLARRFGLESRFGATLDAVADKLAQVVLVTYLALRIGPAFAAVPLWFLGLLIARDLVLLAGVLAIRSRVGRVAVVHRWHGKAASVLLFLLLCAFSAGHGDEVTWPLLCAIAVLVVWSTVLYVRDGFRQVSRAAGGPPA